MIQLGLRNVRLKAIASNKVDAICMAGNLLVESGNIQSGYIESMMRREATANTYLGNGIAIPHGLPNDRELILETGISVVQLPQGVEWNPGETVYLVVGIAAKSDEHLQILTNLTHVLDDEATIRRLVNTDNAQEIIDRLTRGVSAPATTAAEPGFAQGVDLVIVGKAGLHARPATSFVNLAKRFESEIRVRRGEQIANGKSLISLLKLGVEQGQSIRIMAEGRDAAAALRSLQAAVEAGLEEEEEPVAAAVDVPVLELEGESIVGVPASPGIAIAPIFHYQRSHLVWSETAEDPTQEAARLRRAVAFAQYAITDLYEAVKQRSGAAQAAIFAAHGELLDDPELVSDAIALLPPNHSAAWAWQQVIDDRAKALAALSDPVLSGRAADVRDVGLRVMENLADRIEAGNALPDHPVILVAEDLTPSNTATFDPARVQGFCTVTGGPTSHTAIIARSLNIPAVVNITADRLTLLADGTQAILDGNSGKLYPNPSVANLEKARQVQAEYKALQDTAQRSRFEPALTSDGHRVEVVANIGAPNEAAEAIEAGGEGVGLLRTEFLFLGRSHPPSEDEQFDALRQMTHALNGLPLIVRTLDIGGDKEIPYLSLPKEDNPFLGVRGIRLCLRHPQLFETQLRAIFRAAATGYVRIMFPMVATMEELRAAKSIVESVRKTLNAPPVEIGMMVEVPSVVMMAADFAQEVDFFSVGTNDLTQYLLAMDRGHAALAKDADGLHPAVLRAVSQTVRAAEAVGKWVGVCGGVAGDPLGAAILAGLGVHELSVSISSIPAVKAKIRNLTQVQLQRLAQRALKCKTAAEVRNL